MTLTFEPLEHKYGDGLGISVSTLIGKYENEFNKSFWLRWKAWEQILFPFENKELRKSKFKELRKEVGYTFQEMSKHSERLFMLLALKYPKLVEIVEEDIKTQIEREWAEKNNNSKINGTAYHDNNEQASYERGYELNPFNNKKYKVIKGYQWVDNIKIQNLDLYNLEEGYYPELILNKGSVYGQSDRVWIGANKEVWIRDYKTNEKIEKENKFQKLKYPLRHLDDCNYNIYSIQLSMYGWILEQYGYKVQDLALDHFEKSVWVPYLKREVESIIFDYELSLI